ncbi:hypothetical protein [Streptomyces sp. NPDC059909]|uniref:hypothetical protein n=1 Tax=Streptomyces sp. NPDC059909 TaxID=3346998 RepID=UPI0036613203
MGELENRVTLPEKPYRTFVAEMVADVGAGPMPADKPSGFLEWVQRWQSGEAWWD